MKGKAGHVAPETTTAQQTTTTKATTAQQPTKAKAKNVSLFDDDEEDNDDGDEQRSSSNIIGIKINEGYAKRYGERKKREELHRLEEKYGKEQEGDESEEDSEDDEEEDEEGELLTPGVDKTIMQTLALIKAKDPRVYDAKADFFSDEQLEDARVKWEEKQKALKKSKPVKLKDYEREQLLKGKVGDDGEIEQEKAANKEAEQKTTTKTYVQEQRELKDAFRIAFQDNAGDEDADDDEDDFDNGGLFQKRNKSLDQEDEDEGEYKDWLMGQEEQEKKQQENEMAKLQRYWSDPNLDPTEQFLRDYVLNRGWLDRDEGAVPTYEQVVNDDVDAEEVEKTEEFEYKYNFRFEEPESTQVKTFARELEDSVRRKDTKRHDKRKAQEERKAGEKKQKQEELARLRELKKREILDKLKQVEEISGAPAVDFEGIDLEADFDPEAHDRAMAKMFDDQYYDQAADAEKPVFDEEYDELFAEELVTGDTYEDEAGEEEEGNGYAVEDDGYDMDVDDDSSSSSNSNKRKAAASTGDAEADEASHMLDLEIEDLQKRKAMRKLTKRQRERLQRLEKLRERSRQKAESKKKTPSEDDPEVVAKRVVQALDASNSSKGNNNPQKEQVDALLDEYYQLNYEDIIGGDQPTRFKYRQVKPSTYGLTMEEILFADDRDLNAHVSLKKLAPYRPEEVQEKDMRRFSKNKRVKLFREKLKEKTTRTTQVDPEQPEEEQAEAEAKAGEATDEAAAEEGVSTASSSTPNTASGSSKKRKHNGALKQHPAKSPLGANRAIRKAADKAGVSTDRMLSYAAGATKKLRSEVFGASTGHKHKAKTQH